MIWRITFFLWLMCVVMLGAVTGAHAHGTKALVYNGVGACKEDCAQAAADMAERVGLTPIFVGDDAEIKNLFEGVAVWIHPGGFSSNGMTALSDELREGVADFVKIQGGGFVGICAGGFAATRYAGDMDYLGFNVMSGASSLYWNGGKMVDLIPLQWQGKTRHLYFEGGPHFTHLDRSAEIIATYANGQVAAARMKQGNGRVFVVGPHPEAPQWWRDAYGQDDQDGLDYDLVDDMLRWVTAH